MPGLAAKRNTTSWPAAPATSTSRRAFGQGQVGELGLDRLAQGPGRGGAGGGDLGLEAGELGPGGVALGVEGGGDDVAPLELGQALLGGVAPVDHLGERLAVLAAQLLEQLAAGPDLGLALGVALDDLAPAAHVGRQVGELGRDPVEPGRGVGER